MRDGRSRVEETVQGLPRFFFGKRGALLGDELKGVLQGFHTDGYGNRDWGPAVRADVPLA